MQTWITDKRSAGAKHLRGYESSPRLVHIRYIILSVVVPITYSVAVTLFWNKWCVSFLEESWCTFVVCVVGGAPVIYAKSATTPSRNSEGRPVYYWSVYSWTSCGSSAWNCAGINHIYINYSILGICGPFWERIELFSTHRAIFRM